MKISQITSGLLLVGWLLTGCAPEKQAEPNYTTTPQETTNQTVTTQDTSGEDRIINNITALGGIGEKSEQYDLTQSGKTVMTVSLRLPVANITGDVGLQETLTGRLSTIEDRISAYVDSLYEKYAADLAEGRDRLTVPSVQVGFSIHYFTAEAASLAYEYHETTADGITVSHTEFYNIDLRIGSEIMLSALFTEEGLSALNASLQEKVTAGNLSGLYDGADRLVNDLMDGSWYMTLSSIVFSFSPGDVAPVSSGQVTVTFEAEELATLLSSYGSALIG